MDLVGALRRWSVKYSFDRPQAGCQTCGDLSWGAEDYCRTCGGVFTDLDIDAEDSWEPPY